MTRELVWVVPRGTGWQKVEVLTYWLVNSRLPGPFPGTPAPVYRSAPKELAHGTAQGPQDFGYHPPKLLSARFHLYSSLDFLAAVSASCVETTIPQPLPKGYGCPCPQPPLESSSRGSMQELQTLQD